jgi:hypothetical protein
MKVFVRGAYYDPVVKERQGETYKEVLFRVFKRVLEDAEVSPDDVDGVIFTPPVLGGIRQHFMHAHHMDTILGRNSKLRLWLRTAVAQRLLL